MNARSVWVTGDSAGLVEDFPQSIDHSGWANCSTGGGPAYEHPILYCTRCRTAIARTTQPGWAARPGGLGLFPRRRAPLPEESTGVPIRPHIARIVRGHLDNVGKVGADSDRARRVAPHRYCLTRTVAVLQSALAHGSNACSLPPAGVPWNAIPAASTSSQSFVAMVSGVPPIAA